MASGRRRSRAAMTPSPLCARPAFGSMSRAASKAWRARVRSFWSRCTVRDVHQHGRVPRVLLASADERCERGLGSPGARERHPEAGQHVEVGVRALRPRARAARPPRAPRPASVRYTPSSAIDSVSVRPQLHRPAGPPAIAAVEVPAGALEVGELQVREVGVGAAAQDVAADARSPRRSARRGRGPASPSAWRRCRRGASGRRPRCTPPSAPAPPDT